jgi:hypothetical protein
MKRKSTDMVIDKIVAACGGNVRGALEVVLLLNENLEIQIQQLYAALSSADHKHLSLMRAH